MTNREFVICIVAVLIIILIGFSGNYAISAQRTEINNQWIKELTKRGIVEPTESGSFNWK